MIIPVRCFTCKRVIGKKMWWEEYSSRVSKGEDKAVVLSDLSITSPCCRRMFLSHVNLIDEFLLYK